MFSIKQLSIEEYKTYCRKNINWCDICEKSLCLEFKQHHIVSQVIIENSTRNILLCEKCTININNILDFTKKFSTQNIEKLFYALTNNCHVCIDYNHNKKFYYLDIFGNNFNDVIEYKKESDNNGI